MTEDQFLTMDCPRVFRVTLVTQDRVTGRPHPRQLIVRAGEPRVALLSALARLHEPVVHGSPYLLVEA